MASDGYLQRTLDSLLLGFQIVGFDWTYVYVNPVAARHGRRLPADLIGRTMVECYPGIEQTEMFATLRRAMTERTSHVIETDFVYPDGEHRWFEIRVEPVPEGICVYSLDIHARKLGQQEVDRRNGERMPLLARMWRAIKRVAQLPRHPA